MWPIKTVLIATDFSEVSNDAHEAACCIARQQEARLIVLHVAEEPIVSYIEKATELSKEEFQQKLWETLRWPREQENGLNVDHRMVEGDPVKQIVHVAQEQHADLIVMGASGRTGMLRWFTGSVTDDVTRDAPCSVLLVKPTRATVPAEEKTVEPRREQAVERVEPIEATSPGLRPQPAARETPPNPKREISGKEEPRPSVAAPAAMTAGRAGP
jgi:nucleotide-binding universal stress UspA family protein